MKRRKIIIIGDSHVRGCAMELLKYLGNDFEVKGTLMPGARLKNIIRLADTEISSLNKNDAVIIRGGSNDINKTEANIGLKYLKHFVTNRMNTNNIIITAATRHDLLETSCVNKEIEVFNKKLHELMKTMDNVSIINANLHREDFTQHGLHRNSSGKERIVEMIGKHIHQLMSKKNELPIILHWGKIHNVSFYNEADIKLQSGVSNKHLIGDVTGVENLNEFLSEEVKKQLKNCDTDGQSKCGDINCENQDSNDSTQEEKKEDPNIDDVVNLPNIVGQGEHDGKDFSQSFPRVENQ
jgi:hypothetical protein